MDAKSHQTKTSASETAIRHNFADTALWHAALELDSSRRQSMALLFLVALSRGLSGGPI
jgi:hypothetical protein